MKKLCFCMISIFIILFDSFCLGYSNQYIVFDVPDNYNFSNKINDDGSKFYNITSQGSDNMNIVITSYDEKESFNYTQEELEIFINEIEIQLENAFNSDIIILNKKISTVGSKFYKSIVLEYKINDYNLFQKQYYVISDNYVYTITLTSFNEDYFMSNEVMNFLNSIEIKDTITEDKGIININFDKVLADSIAGILIIAVSAIIGAIQKNSKKNKDMKKANGNNEDKELESLIDNLQKDNIKN